MIDKYINFHLSLMLFLNYQPFIYLFIFFGGGGGGSSLVRFIIIKTCFEFFFSKIVLYSQCIDNSNKILAILLNYS